MSNELARAAVLQWAQQAFVREILSNFERAQTFDGMLSQIVLAALRQFSKQELEMLSALLPLGVASTGPGESALRNGLPKSQRQLVERFQAAKYAVRSARWAEYSADVHNVNSEDSREESKSIINIAGPIIKEIAAHWEFECNKIDRTTWKLVAKRAWGEISVHFDLGSALRLTYGVFVYDRHCNQLRRHDHYLGVLGIGPSEWVIESAKESSVRLQKASELVRWHVAEYERILEPILAVSRTIEPYPPT